MNDQDRKAADHIELGSCPTCGHFPAQFVEGGGVIARAMELAAPDGFVMVPRDWLDTVFGMAREGCDSPNAAYRWCERIDEIFFAPKTCDQYAQHKQASPPTMLRLAAAPKPAATEGKDFMAEAIAAGDGTLHGAIDYWQERAIKAEAALSAKPAADGVTEAEVEAAWLAYARAAEADGFEGPDDDQRRYAIRWMRAALAAARKGEG